MFLFQFVKHIIETVIEIYEILLIWWVDPQYPWTHGIGSPMRRSSMTRVNIHNCLSLSCLLYNIQCIHSSGVECYTDLCTSSARLKLNKHGNVNKSPPIDIYFLIAWLENKHFLENWNVRELMSSRVKWVVSL